MELIVTDDILFQRLAGEKDKEAFDAIFRRYYPRLRAYCAKFVGDEADDVAQDCFMSLWNKTPQYQQGMLKSLLFTFARNACLNNLKHKAVIDFKSTDDSPEGSERLYKDDFAPNADEPLLMDELRENLQNAIEELPARTKEAFLLSRVEELSYAEIAAKMNVTVKAVEKNISKALSHLRQRLL